MNRRSLAGGLVAALLFSLPSLAVVKTVVIERRLPVNQYCPIDNGDFDLTFVADQPFARVTFWVINESPGGLFLANKLDNFAVIQKSVYDAHEVVTPGFSNCYVSPGDPNSPALDFTAAGTNEARLDLFDGSANGWDQNNFAAYHGGAGAPRNPATGSDFSGGCLDLGNSSAGPVKTSTSVLVPGLTVGTEYIVTGWWSTADTSRPLNVQIDTTPCVDDDGDGASSCVDCDDRNPHRTPGALEACDGVDNDCDGLVDESAPCAVACDPAAVAASDTRITNTTTGSTNPALAWNGTDFGMFFGDSLSTDLDILFARATVTGSEIGSENPVGTTNSLERLPRAVWTGKEYGVVWLRNKQPVFQRFSRTGLALGPLVPIAVTGFESSGVDIAWTGSEYGVLWTSGVAINDSSTRLIFFQRLSPDGVPLLTSRVQINVASPVSSGTRNPRIAWNGSAYGALWLDTSSGSQLRFRIVEPLRVLGGSIVAFGPSAVSPDSPAIAAGGTTFGIAWTDFRDGVQPEIYFARMSGAGSKIGSDLRVTNAAGQSFTPSIAWSGAEWGIAWDDLRSGDEEIWFGRVSSAGAKLGSDVRVTNSTGQSRDPSIAWAGGKLGVAWSDWRDGGNAEVYFAPLGCNCGDSDADGFSSCVDCDDGNATVYPGAPQACTGVTNDCNNPVWPVPLGVTDDDGDGIAPCEGDCDDTHASVYAGAPQICDGLNNNCNSALWPELAGTNDGDDDGDGFSECAGDCSDVEPNSWATPGEARSLALIHNQGTGVTSLLWLAPTSPGGTAPFYDTLRSLNPADFTTAATCVETNGGGNTVSSDATAPPLGSVFYYLIRAENSCPGGLGFGPLGTDSAGTPRTARSCP